MIRHIVDPKIQYFMDLCCLCSLFASFSVGALKVLQHINRWYCSNLKPKGSFKFYLLWNCLCISCWNSIFNFRWVIHTNVEAVVVIALLFNVRLRTAFLVTCLSHQLYKWHFVWSLTFFITTIIIVTLKKNYFIGSVWFDSARPQTGACVA